MTNQITVNLEQPLKQAMADFERAYFEFHSAQVGKKRGAKNRVAERTGLERTAVWRKLRKLGMKE